MRALFLLSLLFFSVSPASSKTIAEICGVQRSIFRINNAGDLKRSLCDLSNQFGKRQDLITLTNDIRQVLDRLGDDYDLKDPMKKDVAEVKELKASLDQLKSKLNQIHASTPVQDSDLRKYLRKAQSFKFADAVEKQDVNTEMIDSMNKALASVPAGKNVLACFHEGKQGDHEIKTEVKFDPNLEKQKGASGEFNWSEGGNKKTVLLSPEIKSPLQFLLVYAHEMQHGCNLKNKLDSRKPVDELSAHCQQPIPEENQAACTRLTEQARPGYHEMFVDEMRSFRLMAELFKEFAEKDPSLCHQYNVGDPGKFYRDFNITSDGEVWADIEKQLQSGQYVNYVCGFYMSRSFREIDFFQERDGKKVFRKDFEALLKSNGF